MNVEHHRHIFIGGLHRSGTSLLFKILRENPDISGFRITDGAEREHEGQHLQDVYPNDQANGGPGYFGLAKEAHITEESSLVNEVNRQRILEAWLPYWDLEKVFLLEKSPSNFLQMRLLQSLFDDSCFVVLVRHPIAVSLATIKWMGWPSYRLEDGSGQGEITVRPAVPADVKDFHSSATLMMQSMIYSLLRHWQHAHEIMLKDLPKVKNVTLLRYEDLVAQPEEIVQAIALKIGTAASRIPADISIEDRNAPYFQKWTEMQGSLLSPEVISFLSSNFEESFQQFGYELESRWVRDWNPKALELPKA